MLGKLRDALYNIVYVEGDTALQLLADMIRGVDNPRTTAYVKRQLKQAERKQQVQTGNTAQTFTKAEESVFRQLLERQENEEIMTYWKRRKALLAYPNKKALVEKALTLQKHRDRLSNKADLQKLSRSQQLEKLEREFAAMKQLKTSEGQKLKL